jgi:putative endonuclease
MQECDLNLWSVYILRCRDGTLYTGIAKNVFARIAQHNRGKGAAYTRGRLQENSLTHSEALVREAEIKRLSRAEKEGLVLPAIPR